MSVEEHHMGFQHYRHVLLRGIANYNYPMIYVFAKYYVPHFKNNQTFLWKFHSIIRIFLEKSLWKYSINSNFYLPFILQFYFYHNCLHWPLTLTEPGRQPTLTIFPVLVISFSKSFEDSFLKKSLCVKASPLTDAYV